MNVLEEKPDLKFKDKLFRYIFAKNKEWLLSLYNALNNTNYTNTEDLTITTLEDVIYIKMKNDISLLIDSEMNLYEHQSTFNPNMPLRGLLYFAALYRAFLTEKGVDLYGKRLVKIPVPKYVVFYNGDDAVKDVEILKLTDAFEKNVQTEDFQWTATMYNINVGHNKELLDKCMALKDYANYVGKVKAKLAAGQKINEAVAQSVDEAISENLLDGFFKKHEKGVLEMTLTEFNEQEFIENRREEGREEGRIEGRVEGAINMAKKSFSRNISEKDIISDLEEALSISYEEAKKLFEQEVACLA